VVVAHGGSWRGGDKGDMAAASWALAQAGHVVLDVRYRLAPGHRFPAAVADVKCVIGRAREHAAELGLDPARGALLGRSAGGQIALVAAYSAGDPRVPPSCGVEDRPVSAVAALYAPTDLVQSYSRPVRPDVVDGPASVVRYLGGTPAELPDVYRLASPVSWMQRPLPPTLLIHGTGDRLVAIERERLLARALVKAGHAVDVLEVPLAEHAFDAHVGGVGEQLARQVLIRFLSGAQGAGAAR
jgi:acetyl esterase/lipase